MVRRGLIILGLLIIVLGLAALASGIVGPSMLFLFWGFALIAAILIERFRYKPVAHGRPGSGWERTSERFVNDETGKMVTVYIRPETGERTYVEE